MVHTEIIQKILQFCARTKSFEAGLEKVFSVYYGDHCRCIVRLRPINMKLSFDNDHRSYYILQFYIFWIKMCYLILVR